MVRKLCFCFALLVVLLRTGAPASAQSLDFTVLGRYSTNLFNVAAAEIAAYDPLTQRIYFVNASAVEVVVLDVSDPTNPTEIHTIDITAEGGGANSVAVKNGVVAVAIEAVPNTQPGKVVFYDSTFTRLGAATVGTLPDMVVFTPDGQKVMTANEGEPNANRTVNPEGSISIVDVSGGFSNPPVTTADFQSFNARKATLQAAGVRLFGIDSLGVAATVAQDIEPEYITISADSKTAWVTLQEANAFAIVDIDAGTVTDLIPLGYKDHSLTENALDASDQDGVINIRTWPIRGMYMPDAVASYTVGGNTFLITANEGDSRTFEEKRVSALSLDPNAYPPADSVKLNRNLGRMTVTNASGDTDGDGDIDIIHAFGARSFSIWDDEGNLVYDSGDDFERITAVRFPTVFNSNHSVNNSFDNRSDDKGPEPEGVVIGKIGTTTYAFIGLERMSGVMVYDVTNPVNPEFVDYLTTRDFSFTGSLTANPSGAGDLGPEGLIFIPSASSPNGNPLLVLSNEVSGTVSIVQLADLSETPEGTLIDLTDVFAGPGESTPEPEVRLINTGNEPVAGIQFDLDLSAVENSILEDTAEEILDGSVAPEGFQVVGNLVDGGNRLRVTVFSVTGATIAPSGEPVTLTRLRYTAGETLGVEDPISFVEGSLIVSDSLGNALEFGSDGGAIQIGVYGDVTLDERVDVRDVVRLVGEIVGRGDLTLPTDPEGVLFRIRDVAGHEGTPVINVADAIQIINIILEIDVAPKLIGGPVALSLLSPVTLPDGQTVVPVALEGTIAGLEATVIFDPARLRVGIPLLAAADANVLIDSRVGTGRVKLIVVGLSARGLSGQGTPLVYLPITLLGDGAALLTVSEATLVDRAANAVQFTSGGLSQTVSKGAAAPTAFALADARPNPFNPATEIAYEVPMQAHITLAIYNLLGQEVVRLVDQMQAPGRYTVTWNARNAQGQAVSSGVYLYRLISSDGYTESRRMTLLK